MIDDIKEAIVQGKYYIKGEIVSIQGNDAVKKIDEALKYLVEHTYYNLNMIEENFDTDADIIAVLNGTNRTMEGLEYNTQAQNEIIKHLDLQYSMNMPTSMFDIQQKFSKKPYGWRESDIAGVVAQILVSQNAIIKYAGQVIKSNDHRMVGFLRKKTEIGQVKISKRIGIDNYKINQTKTFLREYFDVMDLPNDEDSLIEYIIKNFEVKKDELQDFLNRNRQRHYPGYKQIQDGSSYVEKVLENQNDNVALIDTIVDLQDDLLDNKDDMKAVEQFYNTQFKLFESADSVLRQVEREKDYYIGNVFVGQAITSMKEIVCYQDNYNYSRIPKLNEYIAVIRDAKQSLLTEKKQEVLNAIEQCLEVVNSKAKADDSRLSGIINQARISFDNKKQEIKNLDDLVVLEAKKQAVFNDTNRFVSAMEEILTPVTVKSEPSLKKEEHNNKETKEYYRQVIFPTRIIKSEEDVDKYLEELRSKLLGLIQNCDEIKLR